MSVVHDFDKRIIFTGLICLEGRIMTTLDYAFGMLVTDKRCSRRNTMSESKESTVFCHCHECEQPIYVGDIMHSVTYSQDVAMAQYSVQPLQANSLGIWCKTCFPKAQKRLQYLFDWPQHAIPKGAK